MQNTLPPGITREMIDALKAKSPANDVKLVDLEDSEGNFLLTVLMLRPTRAVLDQVERYADTEPAKGYGILEKNCLKSHHQEVAANDKMYAAMIAACQELMPYSKPELKRPDMDNLPEGITAEMINALEKEGRTDIRIAELQCDEEGNTLPALVCAPKRSAITNHEKWDGINPKKAKQYIIDSSLQSGQEIARTNDWVWFAAYNAGVQLKPRGSAVIKNC